MVLGGYGGLTRPKAVRLWPHEKRIPSRPLPPEDVPSWLKHLSASTEPSPRVAVLRTDDNFAAAEWSLELARAAKERDLVVGLFFDVAVTDSLLQWYRAYASFVVVEISDRMDRCSSAAEPLLETVAAASELGYWVELATPIGGAAFPAGESLRMLAERVSRITPDIVWNLVAWPPDPDARPWQATLAIRNAMLSLAKEIRAGGLTYVYAVGMMGMVGDLEQLHCPACGSYIIDRSGDVLQYAVPYGVCEGCGYRVPGIWESEPPSKFCC